MTDAQELLAEMAASIASQLAVTLEQGGHSYAPPREVAKRAVAIARAIIIELDTTPNDGY